jgi:hypothetical protein
MLANRNITKNLKENSKPIVISALAFLFYFTPYSIPHAAVAIFVLVFGGSFLFVEHVKSHWLQILLLLLILIQQIFLFNSFNINYTITDKIFSGYCVFRLLISLWRIISLSKT